MDGCCPKSCGGFRVRRARSIRACWQNALAAKSPDFRGNIATGHPEPGEGSIRIRARRWILRGLPMNSPVCHSERGEVPGEATPASIGTTAGGYRDGCFAPLSMTMTRNVQWRVPRKPRGLLSCLRMTISGFSLRPLIETYPKKLRPPVIARSETTTQSSWIATARFAHLAMTITATALGKSQSAYCLILPP